MRKLTSIIKQSVPEGLRPKLKAGYKLLQQWRYAGRAVECPFCEKTFARFLPSGALDRPFWQSEAGQALLKIEHINVANAKCPSCGSGERHRLLYFYLRDQLSIFQARGLKLLDVAPDRFLYKKVFSRVEMEYISIDLRPDRRPTLLMSLTDLKFADNTFDAIICYHVLEHIPEDLQAMRELYRVLKPGGWALIQVPIWAADKTVEDPTVPREAYAAVYGHQDHVRRYGLDYKDKLASAGFQVTLDDFIRKWPDYLVRRYGVFKTEDIYLCGKKAAV